IDRTSMPPPKLMLVDAGKAPKPAGKAGGLLTLEAAEAAVRAAKGEAALAIRLPAASGADRRIRALVRACARPCVWVSRTASAAASRRSGRLGFAGHLEAKAGAGDARDLLRRLCRLASGKGRPERASEEGERNARRFRILSEVTSAANSV